MNKITIRFYEELNDFLPKAKQKISFDHNIVSNTSVKDVIESLGVPHAEVDLILVNGKSVGFDYLVRSNDFISVYPVFESIDISELVHLRPQPLRNIAFVLDVHLGKLARRLRLLGFDTVYNNQLTDLQIIETSVNEKRIVLTRDIGILKNKKITHGYWVRNIHSELQLKEILERFDLYGQCKPFSRCIYCNGMLQSVAKSEIEADLPPRTNQYYDKFTQCQLCHKIYWQGTHYEKLLKFIKKICS